MSSAPARSRAPRSRVPQSGRARSQFTLLLGVWAVVVTCAVLAGLAASLATVGYDHALSAGVTTLENSDEAPDVTSVNVAMQDGEDAVAVPANEAVATTTRALEDAAHGYKTDVSIWAATPMLFVVGDVLRNSYLLDADSAQDHARLVDGRWPAAGTPGGATPVEVALPVSAAQALDVKPGDRLQLGTTPRLTEGGPAPLDVVIVGAFTPTDVTAWERDPLHGAGLNSPTDRVRAYGPMLVAPGTLTESTMPIGRLSAISNPHLDGNFAAIPAMTRDTQGLKDTIGDGLGASVKWVVVRSELPRTFGDIVTHLRLAIALAVSVLVLTIAVGLLAVSLVAGLMTRRRGLETEVLRERGASAWQLSARATVESAVIVVTAVLVATPVAVFAYRAMAASGVFGAQWSAVPSQPLTGPDVTAALVAALVTAVVCAGILVVAALRPTSRRNRAQRTRGAVFARSGADVMLALIAVVGVIQLRQHTPVPGTTDPILVTVPALCVLAAAALVARALPAVARGAERITRRSKGVAVPLAGWHVARGGAMRGGVLAVAATATATLGLIFVGTWTNSQTAQADAATGTDIAVHQAGSPADAAAMAAAAKGTLSPVFERKVVLGTRPDGLTLFAIDTDAARHVVTGRETQTPQWRSAAKALESAAPAEANAPGQAITVQQYPITLTVSGSMVPVTPGAAIPPVQLLATPTASVTTASGAVVLLTGAPVPLDGKPHTTVLAPDGDSRVVTGETRVDAIDFSMHQIAIGDIFQVSTERAAAAVSVTVEGAQGSVGTWASHGDEGAAQMRPVSADGAGTGVDAEFTYSIFGISTVGSHLTLGAFPAVEAVPVVLSQDVADELGLAIGDNIDLTVDYTTVTATVAGTVPYVPGFVHQGALWADRDTLYRTLLTGGRMGEVTDAWWGSGLASDAAEKLRAAGFAPVTSRAEQSVALQEDATQVPLRLAWWLAIAVALLLAVVGAIAHASAEAQQRGLTIARIRAIGVSRRTAYASHMAQHTLVTVSSIGAGFVIGLALAFVISPTLVVAQNGSRPVPPAELVVPWGALAAAIGLVLVIAVGVGIPAARAVVRRSTVAALRAGDVA